MDKIKQRMKKIEILSTVLFIIILIFSQHMLLMNMKIYL